MSLTLLGTITDKAQATFNKPITKENFNEWSKHWITTGEKWQAELEAANLPLTAEAVREHIEWQKKHVIKDI